MANVSAAVKFFPTAQEGFVTTTSGSTASGAATVGLNSVAGYSNGDVVALVIDPTDATKKQVFTGVVDTAGVQITGVKWTEGTNQIHTAGATVVDYETATAWALYRKGLLVQHNDDGTHGAVTATSLTTSGNATITGTLSAPGGTTLPAGDIGTADIADDAVTSAKMANGLIYRRQGGSATDWNSQGTNTYDTSAADVKFQAGTILANADPKTITFPVAFTNPPIVVCQVITANSNNAFPRISSMNASSFNVSVITDSGVAVSNQNINWIAVGI